jgi:hypothetical protein
VKSFKLVSLQLVLDNHQLEDVNLLDGLIINKEDEHNRWLIEAFVTSGEYEKFKTYFSRTDDLTIQAIITKRENDPATFLTKILHIKEVEDCYSILFEGSLKNLKIEYAELLLQNLLQRGLSGLELLQEFKEKLRVRPKITELKK